MRTQLLNNVCCWMRGFYPDWAPKRGHVALISLCGQHGSLVEHRPRSAS
ncbi:hypothetical protein [Mycolicibacterium sp. 120270]|nr:hypothetical protein [Mycolicibacterium sp. 120270]MDX1885180.1 hypothetical protein [Mycolicibacterium sp. 120270]